MYTHIYYVYNYMCVYICVYVYLHIYNFSLLGAYREKTNTQRTASAVKTRDWHVEKIPGEHGHVSRILS